MFKGYSPFGVDTEQAAAAGPEFSTEEEGYGDELYPRGAVLPGVDYQVVVGGQRDEQSYAGRGQNNTREHVLVEVVQCLRDQVRQQERHGEEEQVERAGIINTLTQHQEQNQQQWAKLPRTGSVQEMRQLQIKLQQTQTAKTVSDDINKASQEELSELKEQICLYGSAVKHGVLSVELNGGDIWENQLSDSYVDLGIKKTHWRNGRRHSTPLVEVTEPNPKLPRGKEAGAVRELRTELQRCLASLKGKRQRISKLQDQLRDSKGQVDQLQTQLGQLQTQLDQLQTQVDQDQTSNTAETRSMDSHPDVTSQKELSRLREDRQRLQECLEALEKRNVELKQREEKGKGVNSVLFRKTREMIQELDQEKQEVAQREPRTRLERLSTRAQTGLERLATREPQTGLETVGDNGSPDRSGKRLATGSQDRWKRLATGSPDPVLETVGDRDPDRSGNGWRQVSPDRSWKRLATGSPDRSGNGCDREPRPVWKRLATGSPDRSGNVGDREPNRSGHGWLKGSPDRSGNGFRNTGKECLLTVLSSSQLNTLEEKLRQT
nr:centrosomal protein of 152 kDa-like [Salvelinus alpinus]